jgi:hypothetical protein
LQPRFVEVLAAAVPPKILEATHDIVIKALPELELGVVPVVRWAAEADDATIAALPPGTPVFQGGAHPNGFIAPWTRWTPEDGWTPEARPSIFLNAATCGPTTPLHELRHLWQMRNGVPLDVGARNPGAEKDAEDWAIAALDRLGIGYRVTYSPNRADRRRANRKRR